MKKLAILLLAVTLLGGCYDNIAPTAPTAATNSSQQQAVFNFSTAESDQVNQVTKATVDNLNTLSLPSPLTNQDETEYIWWITDDNYNVSIRYPSFGKTYLPADIETAKLKYNVQPVIDRTDVLMKDAGFLLNDRNSSKNLDDDTFYDYIRAYENKKDSIVCILKVDNDMGGIDQEAKKALSFACSGQVQKAYQEQVPFLKALKEDHNLTTPVIAPEILRKSGDFVMLSVGGRRGGYYSILKKTNGEYHFIFSSQEPPPCDIVKKNKIPKGITEKCYAQNSLVQNTIP